MPGFEQETFLACPAAVVFDFLCRPANWVRLAPAELRLRLAEGPELLGLGARVTLQGRRWGVPHRTVSEVTGFEPNALLVVEQKQGPFGRWVHTHRLEDSPAGTRLRDEIDYEPPGGLLGRLVTAASLAKELEEVMAYRTGQLRSLLGAQRPG
jgi:ligand-binding SRPBCC domain-containing protein